jgi:hypothetical protein
LQRDKHFRNNSRSLMCIAILGSGGGMLGPHLTVLTRGSETEVTCPRSHSTVSLGLDSDPPVSKTCIILRSFPSVFISFMEPVRRLHVPCGGLLRQMSGLRVLESLNPGPQVQREARGGRLGTIMASAFLWCVCVSVCLSVPGQCLRTRRASVVRPRGGILVLGAEALPYPRLIFPRCSLMPTIPEERLL